MASEGTEAVEESPHLRDLTLTPAQADTLIRKYLPAANGCVSLTRIKLGFNNMSFLVSCGDGKEYVLRATKETWPKEKVLCEKTCIELMRTMTSLPVPTVLCSDADASEFGCRWILMERMPGRVLEAADFDALPDDVQARLTTQMVGFLAQLQSVQWEKTGSFYPVTEAAKVSSGVVTAESSKPALVEVGPYFEGKHGPFGSSQDFAALMLQYAISEAERKPALSQLLPKAELAKGVVSRLQAGSLTLPSVPIVTFHGDFAFRNMLVEGEGDSLRICALLDWEWAGAKPAYCEWMDCSFGDVNVARSRKFQEECERQGLLCPSTIPGFTQYSALHELAEAVNPWEVGCFGPERDAKVIAEAEQTCERLLEELGAK